MNTIKKYILVDDDPINNIISGIELKRTLAEMDIRINTFEVPEDGLAFLQNDFSKNPEPTILLLDINMPSISGWQFMEEYEKFSKEIRDQITIYILSSSVDPRDIDRAEANKYIKGFILKPLDNKKILSLTGV